MILRPSAEARSAGLLLVGIYVLLASSAVFLPAASGAERDRTNAVVAEARRRPAVAETCRVREDVALTLSAEKIARLDCHPLGIGLEELLVWQQEDVLHLCCVWADGQLSYNPRRVDRLGAAWVPRPVVYFDLHWSQAGEKPELEVRIRADTDKERIQEIMSQAVQTRRQKMEEQVSSTERLAGFVRWWTEVKYNFAFFDHVPNVNWDQVLLEYLPRIQKADTLETYYRELKACAALLQDAHTDVSEPGFLIMKGMPALCIRPIEGKALVTDVGESGEIAQSRITRGTQIVSVDSRSVETILKQDIYPYVCASTPQGRDRQAYAQLLQGPVGTKVTLGVSDTDGSTRDVVLTRNQLRAFPARAPFVYRPLPDGIAYVALNSFESTQVIKSFNALFGEIDKAQGLILDVRENGGGNSEIGDAIIARLIDAPLARARWKTRQHVAAFRAWGKEDSWYEGNPRPVEPKGEKPFDKPLAILVGPGTISAAEDFVVLLHAGKRGIVVGERTAGSTGQPLLMPLPGGGRARICAKRDSYPDGREFVGRGIEPDVEVRPTPQDIRAGRDVVLEKAMEVIGKLRTGGKKE